MLTPLSRVSGVLAQAAPILQLGEVVVGRGLWPTLVVSAGLMVRVPFILPC